MAAAPLKNAINGIFSKSKDSSLRAAEIGISLCRGCPRFLCKGCIRSFQFRVTCYLGVSNDCGAGDSQFTDSWDYGKEVSITVLEMSRRKWEAR